jgi:D-alanyl-lipoteichoic acid acyltransferase DltB (MBOAT superfamily)
LIFSSYTFLFAFLPVCLAGFALIVGRGGGRAAVVWIVACSLFFYAWWNPAHLRGGGALRHAGLRLAVFVLIGLWHGAAWTFVAFGALNGIYVVANHAFRALRRRRAWLARRRGALGRMLGAALTFAAITLSAALFRAPDFATAGRMLAAMLGAGGLDLAVPGMRASRWALFLVALAIVWLLPNTQQLCARYRPGLGVIGPGEGPAPLRAIAWRPNALWAIALTASTVACLLQMSRAVPFLYYQF